MATRTHRAHIALVGLAFLILRGFSLSPRSPPMAAAEARGGGHARADLRRRRIPRWRPHCTRRWGSRWSCPRTGARRSSRRRCDRTGAVPTPGPLVGARVAAAPWARLWNSQWQRELEKTKELNVFFHNQWQRVISLKLPTSKAAESRERPAFEFVLRRKLLLGQGTCDFVPFCLAFTKAKADWKPNQKDPKSYCSSCHVICTPHVNWTNRTVWLE